MLEKVEVKQTPGSRAFAAVEKSYRFLRLPELKRMLLARYAGELAEYWNGANQRVKSHDNPLPLTPEYLADRSQGLIESGISQNLVKAVEILALREVIGDLKDQFS